MSVSKTLPAIGVGFSCLLEEEQSQDKRLPSCSSFCNTWWMIRGYAPACQREAGRSSPTISTELILLIKLEQI